MKIMTTNLSTALLSTLLISNTQAVLAHGNKPLGNAGFEPPPDRGGWIPFDKRMFSTDEARSVNPSRSE